MNSCLYDCRVMHRRIIPREHEFTYRIFMFWLDLDELSLICKNVPAFGVDDFNLYSLNESDYFTIDGAGLRQSIELFLRESGETRPVSGIRMLTLPRMLGYTFNPITVFYVFDREGHAFTSLIQVGNTFGELKPYVVPSKGNGFQRRATKYFYVSPFSELDCEFDFRFELPDGNLRVWIDDWTNGEKSLVSTLAGRRVELTTSNLLALTLEIPLVTLKVIAGIHWEAFKLWRKRIPHYRKESNPHLQHPHNGKSSKPELVA